jgi:Kef-type K+ transport system membrane component KefB
MIAGHEWWLVSRAAGVVALVAVTASTLIGLTLAAGTDATSTWMLAFLLSSALAASALLIARVRKTKLIRTPRAANISVTPTEI